MSSSELASLASWSIFLGMLDVQQHFFPISASWQQHFGFSLDQLQHHEFTHWIHPDDISTTQQALAQLSLGRTSIIFENRWLDARNQYHWLLWNANLSPDKIIYLAAIEITENKQLSNLYQAILETLHVGVLLYQADGTISDCNPYIEELLGVTADTLLGKKTWEFPTIDEEGSSIAPEKLPPNITLHGDEMEHNVVMGVCKPDGELTWLSYRSQALWSKDGEQRMLWSRASLM
ncbi:MAG: PAS domain S-box protein [Thiotrichaceae bacterium]